MRRRLAAGAVLLITVAACAPATSTTAHDPLDGPMLQHDPTVLLDTEMSDALVFNAYDAVSRLRPQFFRHRGETSFTQRSHTQMNVYLDNDCLGGLEVLRSTSVNGIRSIRYLNAAEAASRWGVNNGGGAILLSTRP